MQELREELKPKRNPEAEKQLKTMIQEIESLIGADANEAILDEKLQAARSYIKAKDRVLDLMVIEHYDSWTSLDGLVGELTMEVPTDQKLTKEDLAALIPWIRENVAAGTDVGNWEYNYHFYNKLFENNFSNAEMLFDMLFDEEISSADIVRAAFEQ